MAKSSKSYTPGPWNHTADGEFVCADTPKGQAELAQVFDSAEYGGSLPRFSNARLMASAPGLLDASKHAADVLGDFCDGEPISTRELERVVIILREAIAAAEGGK